MLRKLLYSCLLFVLAFANIVMAVDESPQGVVRQPRDLDVDVWVNRGDGSVYHPGDKLSIYFRATNDCYVTIYNIDTDGYVHILFPYNYNDDNFVRAGRTYRIPDTWDNYDLVVTGPAGIEYIEAIASFDPQPVRPSIPTRVRGDPYNAMNDIHSIIVPSDRYDYVTDLTHFYVEYVVYYPRYVCYDCHYHHTHYIHDPYHSVCISYTIYIDDYWYTYPTYIRYRYNRGYRYYSVYTFKQRTPEHRRSEPRVDSRGTDERRRGYSNVTWSGERRTRDSGSTDTRERGRVDSRETGNSGNTRERGSVGSNENDNRNRDSGNTNTGTERRRTETRESSGTNTRERGSVDNNKGTENRKNESGNTNSGSTETRERRERKSSESSNADNRNSNSTQTRERKDSDKSRTDDSSNKRRR